MSDDITTDDERRWNREHHGQPVVLHIPTVVVDENGKPAGMTYRNVETKLITDPDRLDEGLGAAVVWHQPNEYPMTEANSQKEDDR